MFKDFINNFNGLNQSYKKVFNTEDGKRVLADILNRGYVGKSLVSGDPIKTAMAAAKQELAIEILSQVNMTDEEARVIMKKYSIKLNQTEEN